jgi:hypothetical protein
MELTRIAPPAPPRVAARALLPLFLVSFAAVGVEIALTRFFAVASWSEYGYWVISIAMTGFAVSGVVMVLGRAWFLRHSAWMLPALPLAMLAAGALGWIAVTANPFNPLELQNSVTWTAQLWNILGYYAALFPFYFLAGLAVSLNFVVHARDVGRVYGYDLIGAGAGAVAVLALLSLLHPFLLVPALLPTLALAAVLTPVRRPLHFRAATLLLLVVAEAAVLLLADPRVSEYKPIYAPLNVPESRVVAEYRTPRGVYHLLDNFTERLDTDVSNNAGVLGLPAPPRTLGLYRDGARIAALPMAPLEAGYAPATLEAAAQALLERPRVKLLGASGGFRVAEALALGAREVTVVEPEPMLRRALVQGLGPVAPLPPDPRVTIAATHPLSAEPGRYELVEIAGDFLGADDQNRHAFTAEALAAAFASLAPGGILSVPVAIREMPVYALRVLATVRDALRRAGVPDPAQHVAVIRSAWNLRILAAREPLDPARVATLVAFAAARSFDVSYAPGLDPGREVWNDLPAISLESDTVETGDGAADAVAAEAALVLAGTPPRDAFDRSAVTADRPWLSPLVRLAALPAALERIEILPQQEIGLLVNVAVLAQAALLALLVLLLPALSPGRVGARVPVVLRAAIYFPALGLGFLLVEIALIEHAALLLEDRTAGFALVLTTMLVFSGLGAMLAGRFAAAPGRALALAVAVALAWCGAALLGLRPALLAGLDLPWMVRAVALVLAIAPLAIAMGLPFPLGLDRFQAESAGLLPWAWALNGAFSVIATPLANLLAHGQGISWLLVGGMICYTMTPITLPRLRRP